MSSPYSSDELTELFSLFDKKQTNRVDRADVGLMLRSLGVQVSDRKIRDIQDSLPNPDVSFVDFEGIVHKPDILALRTENMKNAVVTGRVTGRLRFNFNHY